MNTWKYKHCNDSFDLFTVSYDSVVGDSRVFVLKCKHSNYRDDFIVGSDLA